MTLRGSDAVALRFVYVLLLLALPAAAESPEEVAALLLSPRPSPRDRGERLLKAADSQLVLRHLARWSHDRAGWIDALHKRAKQARGAELQRIARMLDALSGGQEAHVGVDVYFVSVPPEIAERILGKGAPTVVHSPKSGAWDRWWKLIREDKRTAELFARALPSLDARPASAKRIKLISYVRSFEMDERGAVEPVIDTVESGLAMRWTPKLSRDRRFVAIDFELALTDVKRPIKVADLELGNHTLKVQVPELVVQRMRQAVTLPTGGHCAWRFPVKTTREGGRVLLVLLRAVLGPPLERKAPPRATGAAAGVKKR